MSAPTPTSTRTGSPPYYAMPTEEVLAALDTTAGGLSSSEADDRLQRYGSNELTAAKRKSPLMRFLSQFDDILIYILLASAGLKAIIGDWVDFTVILVAAVAIALVGFIQEGQAEDALNSLRKMLSLEAQALRNGAWVNVPAETLVPGDIVRLTSGDRAPADVRIIEATNLRVDEAALTGESEPAEKSPQPVGKDAGVGDRESMVFSSTIVTSGNAIGVITATGMETEIGRITKMVDEVEDMDTPLTRKLESLSKNLAIGIGVMVVIMLLIGRFVHQMDGAELISAAIGFAVAAVPEGLPALVTITLALGVREMAQYNAICRKMASVETLGAVTTICSDKTGTLTQNEMTTRVGASRDVTFEVTGTGYKPEGDILVDGEVADMDANPCLRDLILTGALCSDAEIEEENGVWRVVGQPTEGAVEILARKAGLDEVGQRVGQVPFDSEHKFSASLDDMPDGTLMLHVLGAPDRLLDRSTFEAAADGTREPIDRQAWEKRMEALSNQGLRVLAAAQRESADLDPATVGVDDVEDLTFLGLFGIVDPPRPEVTDAIAEAHSAGINVKMITGDHAGTALAIARELGIVSDTEEARALTGAELEAMSQDELRRQVQDVNVYARTSPEHKIRIVRALQSQEEIVAMTGDGVNDAPSITRANVGVAMGIKGTEATKEAADIVLADDNFATIEKAVEEGRRIFDNIRKSLVFLLPTNGAQSLVILVAVLFGWTLPLSPVQILWINLITAVTLSLPLASEPAEPGIMLRKPRDVNESILPQRYIALIVVASLVIGGLALWMFMYQSGHDLSHAQAQTTAVTMLALAQMAFLFNCRYLGSSSLTWRVFRGNRMVLIASGVMIVLQLIFVYAPFMHTWFGSAPITLYSWVQIIVAALGCFLLFELVKRFVNR